jgi:hypothetical protein
MAAGGLPDCSGRCRQFNAAASFPSESRCDQLNMRTVWFPAFPSLRTPPRPVPCSRVPTSQLGGCEVPDGEERQGRTLAALQGHHVSMEMAKQMRPGKNACVGVRVTEGAETRAFVNRDD